MSPSCNCIQCLRERDNGKRPAIPADRNMIILCIKCGNKRCPHALDHEFHCTNSNEAGQATWSTNEGRFIPVQ